MFIQMVLAISFKCIIFVQALHSLTSRLRIFSAKSTAGISNNDSRKGGNFLLGVQKQPYRTRKGRTKKPTTDNRVKTTRRIILKPPFNIVTFYIIYPFYFVSQNCIIVLKLHLSPLQRWHIEIQSKYSLDTLLLQKQLIAYCDFLCISRIFLLINYYILLIQVGPRTFQQEMRQYSATESQQVCYRPRPTELWRKARPSIY